MQTVYLLAISQAFLFILFLSFKRNRNQANFILILWLLAIILTLGSSFIVRSGLIYSYPHLLGVDLGVPLLCGPFLFVYSTLILGDQRKLALKDLLHLMPFILYFIILTFILYSKHEDFKLSILSKEHSLFSRTSYLGVYSTTVLHALIYSGYTFSLLWKSKFADKKIVGWLKGLTGFIVFINSLMLLAVLGVAFPHSIWRFVPASYLSLSLFAMVYGIVFIALKYPNLFRYYAKSNSVRYANSTLSKDEVDKIWNSLLVKMKNEKPYLKSDLTLVDLADEIGVLSKILSQVINEKSGSNFARFVSRYRIEEFKKKALEEHSLNYTLEAIAKECGFATKTSFHTAFKREEHLTPSSFIKEQRALISA